MPGRNGKPDPRKRNGHRRRQAVARLRARHDPCHLCGQPIDYDLPAGDPMCFEADDIVPVSRGGDPYDIRNLAAAHRICNQKRGNSWLMPQGKGARPKGPLQSSGATLPRSRDW